MAHFQQFFLLVCVNRSCICLLCSQKMSTYHGGPGQNYHSNYSQTQSSYYGGHMGGNQGGYYSQWGGYDQYSGYNSSGYGSGYNSGYGSGYNYNYGPYGYPPPGHMMPPPPMGMPAMPTDTSGAVEVREVREMTALSCTQALTFN